MLREGGMRYTRKKSNKRNLQIFTHIRLHQQQFNNIWKAKQYKKPQQKTDRLLNIYTLNPFFTSCYLFLSKF